MKVCKYCQRGLPVRPPGPGMPREYHPPCEADAKKVRELMRGVSFGLINAVLRPEKEQRMQTKKPEPCPGCGVMVLGEPHAAAFCAKVKAGLPPEPEPPVSIAFGPPLPCFACGLDLQRASHPKGSTCPGAPQWPEVESE